MKLRLEPLKALAAGEEHIRGLDLVPHEKKYFADALHPNADGFGEYARELGKILDNKVSPACG